MKAKLIITTLGLALTILSYADTVPDLPTNVTHVGELAVDLNTSWKRPINASIEILTNQTHNAETHANSAEITANTANENAVNAQQTANAANTIAQNAAATVKTFDTRLINAESDATSAQQIAAGANKTADAASIAAQEATTKVSSYDSRIATVESNATEAKQKANDAKQTADAAKSSADKVDQFDIRISTAENNAKEAKDSANKTEGFVTDLDEKYNTKLTNLSTRVDNIAKQGFAISDRVIYGHSGQSLQDVINIAQNDPNISPKLDADHPVIIKLAPTTYKITEPIKVPQGIIIDGENHAILEGGNLYIQPNTQFENFIAINANTFFYLDNHEVIKTNNIYFNNIKTNDVSTFVGEVERNNIPSYTLYFNQVETSNLLDITKLQHSYLNNITIRNSSASIVTTYCNKFDYYSTYQAHIINSIIQIYCSPIHSTQQYINNIGITTKIGSYDPNGNPL
ncbi:hypothetical protein [Fastidiosibacter lacustris]|uniref:hypothetical protein n=1 Tax=Fastidiosibacter lacustris TaxID=2056695 RepID=UPI000E34939F|nr:hypothetical protein [Fastidiosibacter lacustris]